MRPAVIIHLGHELLRGSSSQPENQTKRVTSLLLCGLAPDGVYLAASVTGGAGELLPHRFTLAGNKSRRSVFCGTFL